MSTDDLVERLGFAYNKLSEDILEEAAARIVSDAERIATLTAEMDDIKQVQFPRKIDAVCKTWRELAESAEADLAAAREDAERYRYLREDLGIGMEFTEYSHEVSSWLEGDELDAAIDAARKGT